MTSSTWLQRWWIAIAVICFAPFSQADSPATRPTTQSATQPAKTVEERIQRLKGQAVDLLEKKNNAAAEGVLAEAVKLDPTDTINLYNLACVKALLGKPDEAMDWLEKAADAGYTDFLFIGKDPDLESLRKLPRYEKLFARKAEIQHHAAERTVVKLRAQFGEDYLYDIDDDAKLVFATNIDRPTLDALKRRLTAQAKSQWETLFEHKPDEYILIVVPSALAYRKIISDPSIEGIYVDGAKTLIARRLGQVMTHEFTHALHAADRAPLGQEHALWFCEGLASLFEAATFDGDTLVPADNYRLRFLQRAAASDRLIPLKTLLALPQKQFIRKANLAYGESSSLLLYLHEQGLLRTFYETYKASFERDSSGKSALEEVTGKPLANLEKDWIDWMRRRTPPPLRTGPDGPVLGARLADGIDGMRVTNVVPDGPAARAGVRDGDVIIGIDGKEVRDYQSLVPLMTNLEPGDRVKLSVRRDKNYLDLPLILAKRSDPTAVPEEKR